MEKEIRGQIVEIEPNSKPYLAKRFIADGFDTVLIFMLFMVLTLLVMKTPLASTYDTHYARLMEIRNQVIAEAENSAEQVNELLKGNEEYQYSLFAANLHSYLLKVLAAVIAEALVLILVPLLNRDKATPGKLLTGIMPFSEKRQSRISWKQVIGRFFFVLILDSVFWYLLTGILTFLLIPVFRLTEILLSKKNKTICDFMTGVMIIEKMSYDGIN